MTCTGSTKRAYTSRNNPMATRINNTDINAQGIYLARHGAEELCTLPDLSVAEVNDWQEAEGLQVDFTTVVCKAPEVAVRYVVTSIDARKALEEYHRAETLTLTPHGWGRSFVLRKGQPDSCKAYGRPGGELALEITYRYEQDELPTERVTGSVVPYGGLLGYKIGGKELTDYGVVVSKVYDTLLQADGFKDRTWVRKAKEVAMECVLFAPTWSVLWENRAALWQALQGELSLSTPAGTLRARYLSCSNTRQVGKAPVVSFTLNMQWI